MAEPTELTAIQKFSCPACGAEAVWTPSKRALVCPYCGTESAAELKADGSLVMEQDLMSALQSLGPDQRGWQAAKKTVRCQSCQAVSVFDPTRVAQRCDFCGSPSLLDVEDSGSPVKPMGLMPFQVAEAKVREDIRRWYGSHFWAPGNLGNKAMTDRLHGIYLPYWTFDAKADCPWEAEAGYYYYVKGRDGKSERRTRWESASGRVEHFFDDLLVPASKGVHAKLLEEVSPFPTTAELKPYDAGYLSGWVVEQYQIDLAAAAKDSRGRMMNALEAMCSAQVPGDTQRGLQIAPVFDHTTFKHVLLPVWLLTYQYGAKTFQVAVNGHTGKVAGEYPISWVKVMVAVVLGLIALAVIISLGEGK
jgi:Zn finger protein HypA/HybF involved in hydrogenase expression